MFAESSTTPQAAAAKPPRLDIYCQIHKGLRLFMTDTLSRVGRMDIHDETERHAVLTQVQALLDECRSHLERENAFVHTALEARRPGASFGISAEHEEHLEAIATLESEVRALAALAQPGTALRLYRRLSRFVAENFEHMLIEETRHNAALWDAYSDEELMALNERIVASVSPQEMAALMRWMVPALTPAEQAELLGAMPAPLRAGLLQMLAPYLEARAAPRLAALA